MTGNKNTEHDREPPGQRQLRPGDVRTPGNQRDYSPEADKQKDEGSNELREAFAEQRLFHDSLSYRSFKKSSFDHEAVTRELIRRRILNSAGP
ncbi:hypothetical protein, partial [Paenibacillus macerans]|uniref:hypothetical protein n=1 Tax=Paenibacillus macerans TaxID=44252 RepID=UPI003D2A88CC